MNNAEFGELQSPVKVLIYSSKEIYDSAGFEGRAEADLVAYRDGPYIRPAKSKIPYIWTEKSYLAEYLELSIRMEEKRRYAEMMENQMEKLLELHDNATQIVNSDLSWEAKYDLIFSPNLSRKVFDIASGMSYYDPDTTYEEDVMAFYNAFTEYVGK